MRTVSSCIGLQRKSILPRSKVPPAWPCIPNDNKTYDSCQQHWFTACDADSSNWSRRTTSVLSRKHVRVVQKRYKLAHVKKVRFKFIYAPDDYVFVVWPPLTICAAEHLTAGGYLKVMPKRHSPCCVLSDGPDYLEILQEIVENAVYINFVTHLKQKAGVPVQPLSRRTRLEETNPQSETELQDINKEHYPVEWFVRHITTKTAPCYVIRRYSYRSKGDTVESPEHYSKHFVEASWYREERRFAPP